ncbi:hypothetical protein BGZ75_004596 [Mortierella antarctica]|nr:hypothetical protein BGZ75_004596 [Mortierella antarctica]
MESVIGPAAAATLRHAQHCQHRYGIRHWAAVLTSIPPHSAARGQIHRTLTTKREHQKAARKTRFAPRAAYQPTSASTWIISDGSVSADKEAITLAKALSLPWVIKRVEWRQGLQWLPVPFKKLIMDYHHVVNRKQTDKRPWFMKGELLTAPYPNYVIGSGAKTLPGLLQVSRMSGRASFSAHIHFPALPFIHFDQVFLQRHEVVVQLAGLGLMKDQKNYFRINSTLNSITSKSLELAKTNALEHGLLPKSFFADHSHKGSKSPIVTVLMGGPNEDCSHNTQRMVNRLERLVDVQNCRLLITYSQRTAENTKLAIQKFQERIQNEQRVFVYDPMKEQQPPQQTSGSSPIQDSATLMTWANTPGPTGVVGFSQDCNPYEAMLALADKIVVTADSVAMTNEALATGKPVYVLGGELARGKLKVFHRYLADQHATRAFRPGRVPITPHSSSRAQAGNDTADPLSYPGDHPPWNQSLAGQGPAEAKRIAERLHVMREARIAGRRIPDHVAEATC